MQHNVFFFFFAISPVSSLLSHCESTEAFGNNRSLRQLSFWFLFHSEINYYYLTTNGDSLTDFFFSLFLTLSLSTLLILNLNNKGAYLYCRTDLTKKKEKICNVLTLCRSSGQKQHNSFRQGGRDNMHCCVWFLCCFNSSFEHFLTAHTSTKLPNFLITHIYIFSCVETIICFPFFSIF